MKRDKIYETARSYLGRDASPADNAPEELACAESVSHIMRKALPELRFPLMVSTKDMYKHLVDSPSFVMVSEPDYGDIIISPTGSGAGHIAHGHVGFVGKNDGPDGTPWIMSNNSYSRRFAVTGTLKEWEYHYGTRGGFPVIFFRVT